MNIIGSRVRCAICSLPMSPPIGATPADLASWWRQTSNGMCDGCQQQRQIAALEFIRAKDEVVLLSQLGATNTFRGPGTRGSMALQAATARLRAADARCIALQMWTAERPYPRGKRTISDHHSDHRVARLPH